MLLPCSVLSAFARLTATDMWPMISGANGTSPRREIVIGSNVGGDEEGRTSGVTTVAALIRPPWKIILGEGPGDILDMAAHPGPQSPNGTQTNYNNLTEVCGRSPETGCLYDVFADPLVSRIRTLSCKSMRRPSTITDCADQEPLLSGGGFALLWATTLQENENVASQQPAVYNEMLAAILELNKTVYSPVRGSDDGAACEMAAGKCEESTATLFPFRILSCLPDACD